MHACKRKTFAPHFSRHERAPCRSVRCHGTAHRWSDERENAVTVPRCSTVSARRICSLSAPRWTVRDDDGLRWPWAVTTRSRLKAEGRRKARCQNVSALLRSMSRRWTQTSKDAYIRSDVTELNWTELGQALLWSISQLGPCVQWQIGKNFVQV